MKNAPLVFAMIIAVAVVAGLAYWDEQRESEAALEYLGRNQAIMASVIAQHLQQRLASGAVAGVAAASSSDLLAVRFERARAMAILIARPSTFDFEREDGVKVSMPELSSAFDEGRASVHISRDRAKALGLPERTALAGLASFERAPGERWEIAVVASAERERDREYHARARLLLAVLAASGLVLGFGGIALLKQRRALEFKRELEVRALERARDERLKSLDKAVTLGTMAIGIAHEVSTPLGVISGRAEQVLSRAGADERIARSARSILDETQRISDVIRAFLGIARGDPAPIRAIAPRSLVDNARALVEHRFAKAGIELKSDVSSPIPDVHGDPVLLEQALANLLLNACEACEPGGHVELVARNGGAAVSFIVLDDGSGISTEDAARAHEPFFTTKAARGGSGLGLAIVNEIVKHHGGRLAMESRAPRGTEARIEIPVRSGEAHEGSS
jgi:two-component system, NtrC family, sensor kinase